MNSGRRKGSSDCSVSSRRESADSGSATRRRCPAPRGVRVAGGRALFTSERGTPSRRNTGSVHSSSPGN